MVALVSLNRSEIRRKHAKDKAKTNLGVGTRAGDVVALVVRHSRDLYES